MQMCDRHDENTRRLDVVEQAVGEAPDEGPTEATAEGATAVRELEDPFGSSPDREDEVQTEMLGVALEGLRGRDELGFRLGMKLGAS
jgi:hypothetical protein